MLSKKKPVAVYDGEEVTLDSEQAAVVPVRWLLPPGVSEPGCVDPVGREYPVIAACGDWPWDQLGTSGHILVFNSGALAVDLERGEVVAKGSGYRGVSRDDPVSSEDENDGELVASDPDWVDCLDADSLDELVAAWASRIRTSVWCGVASFQTPPPGCSGEIYGAEIWRRPKTIPSIRWRGARPNWDWS